MNSFSDLGLSEPLVRAVADMGYETPTPIQAQAIPPLLEGRDLLGCARTGTGKTAAFALPLLHRLAEQRRSPAPKQARVLVLTPTRELAIQVDDNFADYAKHLKLRTTRIFGGVNQNKQVSAMARGVDVLVACPGRLLDLLGQGHVKLDQLEAFVLDEADRMLDMGFLPDVRRVMKELPDQRHNLFFSATMPPDIVELSSQILTDPVQVEVSRESSTAEGVTQRLMFVDKAGKRELIVQIASDPRVTRALVFTRTKHGANRVVQRLQKNGIESAAIHGNKSQNARERAMNGFREGSVRVLVATDIAARGIDVDEISHVINYDLPNIPESYVHRIGRTARAGTTGMALSFCSEDEIEYLRDIEMLIGERVKVAGDRIGLPADVLDPGPLGSKRRRAAPPKKKRSRNRNRNRNRNRGGGGGSGGGGGARRPRN
jgi:ATP-dependent RNA helicase RhlE